MPRNQEQYDSQTPTSITDNILHVAVPLAVANDYDGVLGKTGKLPIGDEPVEGAMGLLLKTASSVRFKIPEQTILDDWQTAEASGGSFDSLGSVRQHLSTQDFEIFCQHYKSNHYAIDLLYSDAAPYLAVLNQLPAIPNFALTYGNDPWQPLKATTAGLSGHVEVTDNKEKGPAIASWAGPTGMYEFAATTDDGELLAIVYAKTVLLVDDKRVAFNGLIAGCRGLLIDRLDETTKPSQTGDINPEQVTVIHDLQQAASLIQADAGSRPYYDSNTADTMRHATQYVPLASFIN